MQQLTRRLTAWRTAMVVTGLLAMGVGLGLGLPPLVAADHDEYGRMEVPGKAMVRLPAGEVIVFYEEARSLDGNEVFPQPELVWTVRPAEGGKRLPLDGDSGREVNSTDARTFTDVEGLEVPHAGRYVVTVRSVSVEGPRQMLTFGTSGVTVEALAFLIGGLLIGGTLVPLAFVGRTTRQVGDGDRTKRLQADSRRGAPDFNLRPYAAARDLRFVEPGGPYPPGFGGALKLAEDLQANVMHGELPGGARAMLFHEAVVVEVSAATRTWSHDIGAPGRYTASSRKRFSGKDLLALLLTFGLFTVEGQTPTLRMPFTTAVTRVPEATGVVPRFRIDRRKRFPPYCFGEPEPLASLEDWHVSRSELSDRSTLERFIEGPVESLLSGRSATPLPHEDLQFVFWCGQLMVRTLGYLSEEEELDALAEVLSIAASALRGACASASRPIPFVEELPKPSRDKRWAAGDDVITREQSGFDPPQGSPWHDRIQSLARRYGLRMEDPRAFHRAFPSLPTPGQAFAVLRGPLPGSGSTPGRIAIHAERPLWTGDVGVNAVFLPAHDRAPQTPPDGVPLVERRIRFAVRDGVFAAWRNRSGDPGDFDALVADAVGLARERELASFEA